MEEYNKYVQQSIDSGTVEPIVSYEDYCKYYDGFSFGEIECQQYYDWHEQQRAIEEKASDTVLQSYQVYTSMMARDYPQERIVPFQDYKDFWCAPEVPVDKPIPPLCIKYKNYKGTISERNIKPLLCFYGSTDYHSKPQWLLKAWDEDKNAERIFALQDIIKIYG